MATRPTPGARSERRIDSAADDRFASLRRGIIVGVLAVLVGGVSLYLSAYRPRQRFLHTWVALSVTPQAQPGAGAAMSADAVPNRIRLSLWGDGSALLEVERPSGPERVHLVWTQTGPTTASVGDARVPKSQWDAVTLAVEDSRSRLHYEAFRPICGIQAIVFAPVQEAHGSAKPVLRQRRADADP